MPVARSLRGRVLVWVSVALVALFTLTVVGLDVAFRRTIDRSRAELLEAQLLGLIALAETDEQGRLGLPHETINPQFGVADSGLYGVLWDANGQQVWQSQSLVGRAFPQTPAPGLGSQRYAIVNPPDLPPMEVLLMEIEWEQVDGTVTRYTFGTGVALDRYVAEQEAFRRNVVGWFIGVLATMLIVIVGVLSWVLRPVKHLAREVREVEAGDRTRLNDQQPSELVGLANNMNALIDNERARLSRYRNTLDDLAHSLKTPLAAMQTLLAEAKSREEQRPALQRELLRMDKLVSYQLQRARAGGSTGFGSQPVDLEESIGDLCLTLDKVYLDKQVQCELDIAVGTRFIGDAGDLSEMLGNLIENAYKYCQHKVHVSARNEGSELWVTIDDDGPGISAEDFEILLQRGTRADESVAGQGIGLAVVNETARLYNGALSVAASQMGGARIALRLGRAGERRQYPR